MATIRVNGRKREVGAPPDTPLLYVLTNELELKGPRFGCGLAQCGSCSVLIDGVETRSCVTPLSRVGSKSITTLEGLPADNAVAKAFEEDQAVQCGYCFNGMIVKATELLSKNKKPSEAQIGAAMNGHLCRCGNYPRIIQAIKRAAGVAL
jgi:aerobic-type carbon monoxide dehydrogenase small subunit (CoxS/CutS family)